ncbi:MAG: GAF domain-containing protein, partial [Verrucomicrobia bacterium]|nr:GAF domain-containing protein [Verrucomicrobiota bacterium]
SALAFVQQTGFGTGVDLILGHLGLIRALQGLTPDLSNFNYPHFDEKQFEQRVSADPPLAMSACWYWIRKLQACFFAGDQVSALSAALKAESLLWTSPGFLVVADYHFYAALARASQYGGPDTGNRRDLLEKLQTHQKLTRIWAETCSENFQNRCLLVTAEIARIEGRELDAELLYEQAIHSAHTNGFIQNEAVGNELAARFYSARGFETISHAYLRKARSCYLQWGAVAKVRLLDRLYPELADDQPIPLLKATIGTSVEHLDLATIVRVSQAVSTEMAFGKLIDTIMRTALENAGAERGLLVIPRGGHQRVEAEATTRGDTIVVELGESLVDDAVLPRSIINYVGRTLESVILDDASTENLFSADPYIRRQRARSILCLPLINQGSFIGVLYLENNLTPHVFTPRRIAVLKLLASQAAISLENTRLYRDLAEREAKIRRLVEANIMGIVIWNFNGDVIEANQAFLDLVQYTRDDLVSGRVRWLDLTRAEWRDRSEQALREVEMTGVFRPYEKEYFRRDGSRVQVMIGGAVFEEGGKEGVAFVLDLRQQKRTEAALQKAQTDLAHVARLSTLGELTASITHEINQPLAGMVTNASAGLRWLERDPPDLAQVRETFRRIVRDANRASDVVARIRALFKKAPAANEPLDLTEAIQEVLALVQGELQRNRITVRTEFATDLPTVRGDRIQLQQVLLNLLVNAIEAMSTLADGPRELGVSSLQVSDDTGGSGKVWIGSNSLTVSGHVLVTVRDTGPGLSTTQLEHVFEAYYTTKSQGMGMGLAISRSIIEAHRGHLWATANLPRGAVFQFTLPI